MFEGVDYEQACIYLRSSCSQAELVKEGLIFLMPVRKKKGGTEPGMRNEEMLRRMKTEESEYWVNSLRKPTATEKRKIVAMVIEVGIRQVMGNHFVQV